MNYLFFDYETSGRNEVYDQILQFGAIKTDSEFRQLGEPIEFFCKLRRDVLPSPGAIKVNQIDINELNSKGLTEFEFAKRVSETLIGDGDQCVVGYNSKSFDNKFTRFLLYRNFFDPYSWSYLNRNSCFDVFDVMSLGYSFDQLPGIKISDESGPSLRLENLAKWNNLPHDDAHDAVSDVKATIHLAKLVKERSPKLIEHVLRLRNLEITKRIITTNEKFFHSSSFNGYDNKFLSLHTSICRHPTIPKSAIGWNLKCDPSEILQLSVDEIRQQMYSKKELKTIEVGFDDFKLNQSPMVIPYDEKWKGRVVDYEERLNNFNAVKANITSLTKLAGEVFESTIPEIDPDADLYAGDFFGEVRLHAKVCNDVRSNPIAIANSQFTSPRLRRLLGRLKARNFFDELEETERSQYQQFCSDKFACTGEANWITKKQFDQEMADVLSDNHLSERQMSCLTTLRQYADNICGI
ncbi:MAG: exodeoxyribonuclease I [Chloracidobacterium sp.]|nr:exodeoxyribonuclease I [Chloracidobacterium sp.]